MQACACCLETLAAAQNSHLHERMSISIDEKKQDAKELYHPEKEAMQAKRYKGAIPTESVLVADPAGDLSTLIFQKPLGLKPASIFASGKVAFVSDSFI